MSSTKSESVHVQEVAKGKEPLFFPIFSVLVIVEAVIEWYALINVRYAVKPVVTLLLIIYFYSKSGGARTPFGRTVFLALIASLFGDIFLMFKEEIYFLLGLGSFAIAHVFYCYGYLSTILKSNKSTDPVALFARILPYLIYGGFLYSRIMDNLGGLKIPVTFYTCILSFMGVLTLVRATHTTVTSFKYTAVGAMLFIFSDSLIGLSMFNGLTDAWVRPAIMVTYYFGQYLISRGALQHIYVYESNSKSE